ncbi:MAG: hypothetical protein H0X63_08285 [Flavobacteriales bacterium]|nr:hypothetical protein [Flavobacteriales bacterium]
MTFEDFQIQFHDYPFFEGENLSKLENEKEKSAPRFRVEEEGSAITIFQEIGESIEEKTISIYGDNLIDLKIEQRYSTNLSINDEGPHCDLKDWKTYSSEWKPIKELVNESIHISFLFNNPKKLKTQKYNEEERKKFHSVSIKELKREVYYECGYDWLIRIKDLESINDYRCSIGISGYFLRITAKRKSDGKEIVHLININSPLGC